MPTDEEQHQHFLEMLSIEAEEEATIAGLELEVADLTSGFEELLESYGAMLLRAQKAENALRAEQALKVIRTHSEF